MYKALLIGCGNIGALYDLESEDVHTHVKAYSMHPHFELTIFDVNKDLQEKIATKYVTKTLNELTEDSLKYFDCISICTPTSTHFEYLSKVLKCNTKVVLCEKPVSNIIDEITQLKTLYNQSHSKLLVNYMRRFQPDYIELKKQILGILNEEQLTNISIRYQRGFINNCSHAFDLLQFLINKDIDFTNVSITNKVHDHFEIDPTLSMSCDWHGTNLSITGLSNVRFSLFEIDIYFEHTRISIQNAGKSILFSRANLSEQFLQPLMLDNEISKENCLKNYMIPVIENAYQLLCGSVSNDNFLSSCNLNQMMLNLIKN